MCAFYIYAVIDCELGDLKDVTDDVKQDKDTQTETLKQVNGRIPQKACESFNFINYIEDMH